MYYIIGIIFLLVVLLILLLKRYQPKSVQNELPADEPKTIAADCCGAHEVCEFDEADLNEEIIVYFDDEELDRLRNVKETDLTSEQIDELREVMYTLRADEINKWMTSLARRHIHLPEILKQEAQQLIAESR